MLAWDHNAYYHQLLLRAVPAGANRVLEIGCGTGDLAARLAGVPSTSMPLIGIWRW